MSDLGTLAEINDIYTERNIAVAMGLAMAVKLNYDINIHVGDDPDWIVVFIKLPSGQVSWHIPRSEYRQYFPEYTPVKARNPWDGHTTEQKNERIQEFAKHIFDDESCAGHEYDEELTCQGCGKMLHLNGETLCSMCAEAGPLFN